MGCTYGVVTWSLRHTLFRMLKLGHALASRAKEWLRRPASQPPIPSMAQALKVPCWSAAQARRLRAQHDHEAAWVVLTVRHLPEGKLRETCTFHRRCQPLSWLGSA